jgi:GTPase SAR1 family protein
MAINPGAEKEFNLLLLGETGVGKSTFINAFVNYNKFKTLNDAETSTILCPISTSFTISDGESYGDITVTYGVNDGNESFVTGQAATQSSKCYMFQHGNNWIRLIDTPGIGDPRGVECDKINFDDILSFISDYDNLHAICILLQPNVTRLSASFQYCIKQLFCHLSKSASQNMVFIFTNSGPSFKPGGTLGPLKEMLKQTKDETHVNIALSKKNVFCVDNEAFRFLVAVNNRIEYSNDERANYSKSWKKSSEECMRLLNTIIDGGLPPHKVKESISVNNARRLIIGISNHIAVITQNIYENIEAKKRHEKELKECDDDIDKLKQKLYMPEIKLIHESLDKPRTVCAGPTCLKEYRVGDTVKYDYAQVCHDGCGIKVEAEKTKIPKLRKCRAIERSTGICKFCKCHYEMHMHIYKNTRIEETQRTNVDVSKKIDNIEDAQKERQKTITYLSNECTELNSEKEIIINITAKFANFLKNNAIVPFNDSFKDYLEHLIENEKTLTQKGSKNKENIENLEKMVAAYDEQKRILDNAFRTNVSLSQITTEDVFEMIKLLRSLPHCGPMIIEAEKAQIKAMRAEQLMERQSISSISITKKLGMISIKL